MRQSGSPCVQLGNIGIFALVTVRAQEDSGPVSPLRHSASAMDSSDSSALVDGRPGAAISGTASRPAAAESAVDGPLGVAASSPGPSNAMPTPTLPQLGSVGSVVHGASGEAIVGTSTSPGLLADVPEPEPALSTGSVVAATATRDMSAAASSASDVIDPTAMREFMGRINDFVDRVDTHLVQSNEFMNWAIHKIKRIDARAWPAGPAGPPPPTFPDCTYQPLRAICSSFYSFYFY